MNRPSTYRFTALLLACMVFLSTSMNSMSLHYCGGNIAGISLFSHDSVPATCCTIETSDCKQSDDEDCCTDEYIDLDWDTSIAIDLSPNVELDADPIAGLLSLSFNQINSPQAVNSPQAYIPPLLQEDRSVLFQQFLL